MTDRPILFSAPMVRALLDGRKTQTRRILNPQPYDFVTDGKRYWNASGCVGGRICVSDADLAALHHWGAGDRLYVREDHYRFGFWEAVPGAQTRGGRMKWRFVGDPAIRFDAPANVRLGRHHKDPATSAWHKRLGRFMFRRDSRLTLIVEGVKVERLQDIGDEDARDEGVDRRSKKVRQFWLFGATQEERERIFLQACGWEYRDLWNSLHGPDAWDANPWVVALTFRVIQSNIDSIGEAA